jgi:hypothetical protein
MTAIYQVEVSLEEPILARGNLKVQILIGNEVASVVAPTGNHTTNPI